MKDMPVLFALLLSLALFCPDAPLAEEPEHGESLEGSYQIDLPTDLRRVLSGEMVYLQKGMMSLVPAIAGGHWNQVKETASRIHDSYIMKKKLSPEQKKILLRALPPLFKEWDRSFHRHAAKMAQAAEQGEAELVVYYFSKLNEACVGCHSRYAAARFPGFASTAGGNRR